MEAKLYLCATPIGNLSDITERVKNVLCEVAAVYCEDTRSSAKLLNHLGIKAPLVSCHEHNENARAVEICARIASGEAVAFISDAGMPGISDPGERLVRACIEEGVPYEVLPGASASLTALVKSGMPAALACFVGFLPRETGERRALIGKLSRHPGTLIIYESPHRVSSTCKELCDFLSDRKACLVRELTKLYEQAVHGTLSSLGELYAQNEPKGECVLLVSGAPDETEVTQADVDELLKKLLSGGMSAKDAAKQTSAMLDISRNDAYRRALELKG